MWSSWNDMICYQKTSQSLFFVGKQCALYYSYFFISIGTKSPTATKRMKESEKLRTFLCRGAMYNCTCRKRAATSSMRSKQRAATSRFVWIYWKYDGLRYLVCSLSCWVHKRTKQELCILEKITKFKICQSNNKYCIVIWIYIAMQHDSTIGFQRLDA